MCVMCCDCCDTGGSDEPRAHARTFGSPRAYACGVRRRAGLGLSSAVRDVPINPVHMSAEIASATAAVVPSAEPNGDAAAAALATADAAAVAGEPQDAQPLSLKMRALIGSAWTMSDYALSRGLALGCNVILAWMLMPEEAFGLMATVSVFLMGLAMFSDIGIGPNIIFSRRG